MKTTTKTITLEVPRLVPLTSYTYDVSVFDYRVDAFVKIYGGRCFANAEGSATLRLDGILRDHVYDFGPAWSATAQSPLPTFMGYDGVSEAVESGGTFFCALYSVVVRDSFGRDVYTYFDTVWAGFAAPWQEGTLTPVEPSVTNLVTIGNGELPHLPPLATQQYWLSLAFVLRYGADFAPNGYTISIDGRSITVKLTGEGTHNATWMLQNLLHWLNDHIVINGGRADSTPIEVVDGGDAFIAGPDTVDGGSASSAVLVVPGSTVEMTIGDMTMAVAVFDVCPSPYYVAWRLPSGGWMSWGFDGNVLYNADTKAVDRVTLLDTDEVVAMDTRAVFTLHSGFVTREQYNLLCTLRYAREVYVYDTQRDRGTWCIVDSRQGDTAGEVRWRNAPFTAVLKEKQHRAI